MRNNCQVADDEDDILAEGWVGFRDGTFYFRPSRGSGGFALYDTEKAALRNTGCSWAYKVQLLINVIEK